MASSLTTTSLSSETRHNSRSTSRGRLTKTQDQGFKLDPDNSNGEGKHCSGKNSDDDRTKEGGGISDHDEQDGEERRYAKESPFKGKRHLTSRVSTLYYLQPFQWLTRLRPLSRSRMRTIRRNRVLVSQTGTFHPILQPMISGLRKSSRRCSAG